MPRPTQNTRLKTHITSIVLEKAVRLRELKIKLKSLAEEQRIIRFEEKKCWAPDERDRLHNHRIHDVRPEIRSAHIAYGLLRGKKLDEIETRPKKKPYREPDWQRIDSLTRKFGFRSLKSIAA